MKINTRFFLLLFSFLVVACSQSPLEQAEQTAVDFSEAMYSLKLDKAKEYCTPKASKIIDFIASNVKEEDFTKLKEAGDLDISILESNIDPGDSTATVKLKISNFIQLNLLTGKSTIEKEKEEEVDMVKVNDKWLVDLHK